MVLSILQAKQKRQKEDRYMEVAPYFSCTFEKVMEVIFHFYSLTISGFKIL